VVSGTRDNLPLECISVSVYIGRTWSISGLTLGDYLQPLLDILPVSLSFLRSFNHGGLYPDHFFSFNSLVKT